MKWQSIEERRDYYRNWRDNNREKRRKYQREYYFRHWDEIQEASRVYKLEHKKESKISLKTRYRIKKGLIERKPCDICREEKTQAHHPNYARPFFVQQLCAACHKKWHLTEGVLQRLSPALGA